MSEQLNQAYSLIKQGQTQAAIDMLEPIIRNDRDNEDAWWLLANATSDSAAKRNALNNVLRLTSNDTRKNKAQIMIESIDSDPFDFDVAPSKKQGMTAYQELDDVPQKKSGGLSCATIVLIFVGLVGVCACIAGFGIFAAAGEIMQSLTYSDTYDDMGSLSEDTSIDGTLTEEATRDGYHYSGQSGDVITMTLDYDALGSPIISIFDEDTQALVSYTQPSTGGSSRLVFTLASTGDYLITVNSFTFIGQEFGYGDYTLEFEAR